MACEIMQPVSETYVASIAMHSAMGDPTTNLDRIAEWSSKAREQGAAFALFPEECITGSMNKSDIPPEESMRIAEAAAEQSVPFLESLCRELDMTLVVGTIEPAGSRYRNSAYIVGPGGYLATFTKLHIPNATERVWFEPGSQFPVVTSQGWTFGVGICYDLRFPEIFRTAAQQGADFFSSPWVQAAVLTTSPPTAIRPNRPLNIDSLPPKSCQQGPWTMRSTFSTPTRREKAATHGFQGSPSRLTRTVSSSTNTRPWKA